MQLKKSKSSLCVGCRVTIISYLAAYRRQTTRGKKEGIQNLPTETLPILQASEKILEFFKNLFELEEPAKTSQKASNFSSEEY